MTKSPSGFRQSEAILARNLFGATPADAVKLTQRVVAAIPVTVQQATITQVDGTFALPVAPPETAVASADGQIRGGIAVTLQPKLADGLPGVVDEPGQGRHRR